MSASKKDKIIDYLSLPVFVILGASEDRSKFGNKVLRYMADHNKECIPISKKSLQIEGINTVDSLTSAASIISQKYPKLSLSRVGMNIITPPGTLL